MKAKLLALKARLRKGGGFVVRLQGRCMDPLLIDGDQAKIVPFTKISVGRLYLFLLPGGGTAVHRMVGKDYATVRMKGDHSKGFELIPKENLVGMVSEIILFETNETIPLRQNRFVEQLFAMLSAVTVKDKQKSVQYSIRKRISRRICASLLVFFSYLLRRYWLRKARRCLEHRY